MPADADAYTLDRERIQDLPREGWAVASADRERLGAERPMGSGDKARNLHNYALSIGTKIVDLG